MDEEGWEGRDEDGLSLPGREADGSLVRVPEGFRRWGGSHCAISQSVFGRSRSAAPPRRRGRQSAYLLDL